MRRLNNNPYRFRSIVGLKMYFSEYLSSEEMEIILLDRTKSVLHLECEPMEIAHLTFIASCAQAMELASVLKMIGLRKEESMSAILREKVLQEMYAQLVRLKKR